MGNRDDKALEIASFRYRVIADAAEADDSGVTGAVEGAAAREYVTPDGKMVKPCNRTLWRWLNSYRNGGLGALEPKRRRDSGQMRAIEPQVLYRAVQLRRENDTRATKTVIDILERLDLVGAGELKRSTLDRHLDRLGVSRRRLHGLGKKTYKKILTTAPLELVMADFHHGPYVRVAGHKKAQRALLLAFIDHFSRYILEARYYLHEDFAALRFGFRRVLLIYGCFTRLYIDNGPSFQTARFHAACKNRDIDIQVVHSKAYTSEGRGCCERYNETIKYQFENEVRGREELLTLDELNHYHEAWLAERYHHDIHSETGQSPFDRFQAHATLRSAPELGRIEELLRLRKSLKVHKKWSTVEVRGIRYVVEPALRGRRVHVLYDTFDPDYVLIEFDGTILQRAYQQKAGVDPPELDQPEPPKTSTDYLALLRRDYEQRTQQELSALDLRARPVKKELSLAELEALMTTCRNTELGRAERAHLGACFRKLRPIDPATARRALEAVRRRLGLGLHISVYCDALQSALVRQRDKGAKTP